MTEENQLYNHETFSKDETRFILNKFKLHQLTCSNFPTQKILKIDTFPITQNESEKKLKIDSPLKSMRNIEMKSMLDSVKDIKILKNKNNNPIENFDNIISDKKVKLSRYNSVIIYNKKIPKISNILHNSQKLILNSPEALKNKNEKKNGPIYSSQKILENKIKKKKEFFAQCYTFGKNTEESNNSYLEYRIKFFKETINTIFRNYLFDLKKFLFNRIKNTSKEILYEVDEKDYELLFELESMGVRNIKEFNSLVKEMVLWIKSKQK